MSGFDDMTPEEMAERRRQALQQAAHGQQSPPLAAAGPPPAEDSMPWERPALDFQRAAAEAGRMQAEDRRNEVEQARQDGGSWQTRAEQNLIEVDLDGTPVASVNRAVDMNVSQEYGAQSKQAISVINKHFANQDCSEIHFNAPDRIFAKYQGQRVKMKAAFSSEEEYNRFVEDLIKQADTPHTWADIKREGQAVIRMASGDRMMIFCPPLVDNIHIAIHKVVARTWDMGTLVENGTVTGNMANLLTAVVQAHGNILICGEMGAGKSTMLSLLTQHIPDNERIALIEEVPEVFMTNPDVTRITYNVKDANNRQVTLADVLDTALYGRYDRVIIGELHDQGAYRMLRTMATGGDGSMCTFHAGDVKSALEQVRNHVILEYPQIPPHVAAHFIRQAINLVVVIERINGQHRVKEISEVEWRNLAEGSTSIGMNRMWYFDRKGEHPSLGGQPGFVCENRPDEDGKLREKSARYGVTLEDHWFPVQQLGHR